MGFRSHLTRNIAGSTALLAVCWLSTAPASCQQQTERAGTIVRDLNGSHGPETYEWVNGKRKRLARKELVHGLTANSREPLTLKVQNVNTFKYSVAASTQQAELFVQSDGFLKGISGLQGRVTPLRRTRPRRSCRQEAWEGWPRSPGGETWSDLAISVQPFSDGRRNMFKP